MHLSRNTMTLIKNSLKKVVCPLMYYSGYYNYKLRRMNDKAVILMYHRVTDDPDAGVTSRNFERQMRYIKENMNPVSVSDIAEWLRNGKQIPPKAVAITFDDGYEDNYTNAYPILKDFSIPATIFLTTGYIGTKKIFWWDKVYEIVIKTNCSSIRMSDLFSTLKINNDKYQYIELDTHKKKKIAINMLTTLFKNFKNGKIFEATIVLQKILNVPDDKIEAHPVITWKQIVEMSNNGIEFGAHTISHPNLCKIDIDEAKKEILLSKTIIEDNINKRANGFAIPFGYSQHYNREVINCIKNAGFLYVCSADSGYISSNDNVYALKRISMPNALLQLSIWNIYRMLKIGR
jgi:peptidoglycan/xylan/chitin deacetylase (PgdA/CDA1 family)